MTRSIAHIQADLASNREESIRLGREQRRLQDELKQAKIAEQDTNPHPWLGKKVKRGKPTHSWKKGATTKTIRGTLKVYREREFYRGGDPIQTGDLIVVTDSGLTAYRFETREGEQPWELDE
jgi:hypothetical protein